MRYRIEFRASAMKALRKVHPIDQKRIQGAIALLAQEPRPPVAVSLRQRDGMRVRVGDYRIIYTVQDDVLLVVVVSVGHSKDIYR